MDICYICKKHLGEKIRIERTKKGFSQEYVGQKLGLSQIVISNIESGKRKPDIEEILKLSEILEVSPTELIDYPVNIEFKECTGSGIIIHHHFPQELISLLTRLVDLMEKKDQN